MASNQLLNLGRRRKIAGRPQQSAYLPRRRFGRIAALGALIALGAMALVGPTGVRAWSESARALEERQANLTELRAERDRISNRVELVDPANADPDLVGELLRSNLNVAHVDEVVINRDD